MISAVVLTKNEENNIVDCLESISWCDEIIIIDDFSTDRTLQVATNLNPKIKIFENELDEDFAKQRNFALSKAKGDWILFIDADERLSNGLKGEIIDFLALQSGGYNGFYFKRIDSLWGKQIQHGEAGRIKLIRLGKKDSGQWSGNVHENWKITGKIGEFNSLLLHFPHQSITEFLKEINYYTDIRAKELYDKRITTNIFQIFMYPTAKFTVNYFLKLGFMDGIEGLVFTIMMSFHSFLVRAKLWTYSQKK
jgi:glycosyltransferase involved in cell wall biosynthesis